MTKIAVSCKAFVGNPKNYTTLNSDGNIKQKKGLAISKP